MKHRHRLILTLMAAGLAGCTTAKEQHLENGFRVMTGEEITSVFSGQTVEGRYGDGSGTFVEYRSADGRLTTVEPSRRTYYGTWEIDDDWLCFIYADSPKRRCVEVVTKDGQYIEFRTGGPSYGKVGAEIISIQPGNVRDLPLK